MAVVESVLAFIILVGILVFIHELGHFLAARWTGMRADVFAVGMGPRLFGWNRKTGFSFGKLPENLDLEGGTDYRIAALPIGGYVKIVGMVDESMDTDFATRPPQPWEFRSKGTLAKVFVISAGVIMNVLLAIALFWSLSYSNGREYQATTTLGVLPSDGVAYNAGLRPGDKITAVNGQAVKYFDEIREAVALADPSENIAVNLERDGRPMTVTLPRPSIASGPISLYPERQLVRVDDVVADKPAAKAGFRKGDVLVKVDGVAIGDNMQVVTHIRANSERAIRFDIDRGGQSMTINAKPDDNDQLGFTIATEYEGPKFLREYSLGESFTQGIDQTITMTAGTFGLVGRLVSGEAKFNESVGGPVMIATMAREQGRRSVSDFVKLMAMLSVTLACMNILPIPALDGGHLVFILIEAVIRREVPLKVRMAIQQVGFALLLIFMIFVLKNDIVRMLN